MDSPIQITDTQRQMIEEFRGRHKTGLLSLVFTDIVGSTALKRELGESLGGALIEKHKGVVRDLLRSFPEAMEVSTAGDSFFLAFLRPSDSVKFSLLLHSRLREFSKDSARSITVRIGIHMGEVFVDRESGAGPVRDILGIQVDSASRIMSLAQGEQILMSRSVFDNARAVLRNDDIPNLNPLSWLSHGPYALKGVEDPVEICEAGEKAFAVLTAPPDTEKAKSIAPIDNNLVVGWRPSPGAQVPTAPGWFVTEKLGEGGFGEVWKAQKIRNAEGEEAPATETGHLASLAIGATVAFKFCFDLAHARALRREATLFRLLQKKQAELKHTAKLLDCQLSSAPLYLAMEFVAGKNLAQWLKEEGAALKPIRRLQMMAPVAQAIHDIHEAGVIINDIKPSNIIVRYGEDGKRSFVLTDLGIGQVRDKTFLDEANMTRTTGFTKVALTAPAGSSGAPAGSLLYLAPELLEGQPPSVASDAYALGVTLMQVASGNARMAPSDAWRKQVPSRLSRRLIGALIRGEARKRTEDLGKLARRLQTLPRRQTVRKSIMCASGGLFLLLALFLGYRTFILTPRMRDLMLKEKERVAALGLATDIESFNKKYPATRRGEIAISKAAAIFQTMTVVEEDRRKKSLASKDNASTQTVPQKGPGGASKLEMFRDAVGNFREQPLDYQALKHYLDENRVALDDLIALSKSVPYRELNWIASLDRESPFPIRSRSFGTLDKEDSAYVNLRSIFQVLLPLAMQDALSEGDENRACDLLVAFLFLTRAFEAQGTSIVSEMICAAVKGIALKCASALVEHFPPDKENAIRLYDIMDPQQNAEDLLRGFESEFITCNAIWQYFRGDIRKWPIRVSKQPEDVFAYSTFREKMFFYLPWLHKPELYDASAISYAALEFMAEAINSRKNTFKSMEDKHNELERRTMGNDIAGAFLPGFMKATDTAKQRLLLPASLLCAALLLRVAEIDTGGDPSKMPTALAPLFAAQGDPPPLDYCGDTLESQIKYVPNPEKGTYLLRHEGMGDKSENGPFEFQGRWGWGTSGPRRYALLVGVNEYPNFSAEQQLVGPESDVNMMKSILFPRYRFQPMNIKVLAGDKTNRSDVTEGLEWLGSVSSKNDVCVFYFSGYGAQVADENGDETGDKLDEILCPRDFKLLPERKGINGITDDELRELVKGLFQERHFVMILDAVHSGGFDEVVSDAMDVGGQVLIAACRDYELAAETSGAIRLGAPPEPHGVLTLELARYLSGRPTVPTYEDVKTFLDRAIVQGANAQNPVVVISKGLLTRHVFGVPEE